MHLIRPINLDVKPIRLHFGIGKNVTVSFHGIYRHDRAVSVVMLDPYIGESFQIIQKNDNNNKNNNCIHVRFCDVIVSAMRRRSHSSIRRTLRPLKHEICNC